MRYFEKILLIAAVHGQEEQTLYFAERLDKTISPNDRLKIQPNYNPWGIVHACRGNVNGVDLNRNLPSSNWQASDPSSPYFGGSKAASEIETQLFLQTLQDFKADLVISLHTNHFVANPNPPQINFDAASNYRFYAETKEFALKLSQLTGLPFTEDIGYPTPGSLGSYAKENSFACITVEFDDNKTAEEIWLEYGSSFQTILKQHLESNSTLN